MTTFAQDSTKSNNLIGNYNSWLKNVHLGDLLEASTIKSTEIHGKEVLVLILKPTLRFKDPQEFATNWTYIKDGLQENGVSLDKLLWSKWADYLEVPPNQVFMEVDTDDPSIFSWKASYDKTFVITEKISQIRGSEASINYNFGDPGNLINKRYLLKQPIADLGKYLGPISSFFKKSKHPAQLAVMVNVISSAKELMMLEVVNVFGEATRKNYHEKIRLMVTITETAGSPAIEYWGTVWCAGGIARPSEFVDAANEPDLNENLRLYNQAIDRAFKVIFHENIQ